MEKEVKALSALKHKGIVKLIGAIPKAESEELLIIMEYLAGKELYDYWKRFEDRKMPEKEVAEIML